VAGFDLDPMETLDRKLRWLAAAADGQWQCAFSHETRLAYARIVHDPKTQFAAL
jgi:hypothetical protein